MIATLTFDVDGDDKFAFEMACSGRKLASIMWDLDQWLRNECKYKDLDDATFNAYEAVRDKLRELFDDNEMTIGIIS